MTRASSKITDSFLADGIIVLLGMVVLTQFYTLFWTGAFIPSGFGSQISNYILPYWGNDGKAVIGSILPFDPILAPLLGIGMFIAAICLILLIGRKTVTTLVGIGFFIFWMLTWSYPGAWTFEFLFPALFAVCAGLSKLTQSNFSPSIYSQLSLSKSASGVVILLLTALLYYITSVAFYDQALASKIATSSALTFCILSFLNLGLDKCFVKKSLSKQRHHKLMTLLADWPWIDIMTMTMGGMMVMQVYSNYFSGLYVAKNAADLIKYYSVASGSIWLHPFLAWSSAHMSSIITPYAIFEIFMAIALTLAILRGPALILSAIIFGILAFAELKVSANWPPDNHFLTWEWELMFITVASIFIGVGKLIESFKSANLKEVILGRKFFHGATMTTRFFAAVVGAAALYFIGIVTQVFGDSYKIISLSSGITFLILLLGLAFIDKYRGYVIEEQYRIKYRTESEPDRVTD